MSLKPALVVLALIALTEAFKSYEDYKVLKVIPNSETHVQLLTELRGSNKYEFWTESFGVGDEVRIMVSPDKENELTQYINQVNLHHSIAIDNVQSLINTQNVRAQNPLKSTLGSFDWETYHTLNEIHTWLDELEELYPGIVSTFSIGQSNEGRSIKGVKIDFKADREDPLLIGMIEGGIHAVEWISPATVTWIIKEFLTSSDANVRSMAENLVWHIIPVANPDGYEYTFTQDRMWRKNRNPANYVNCTDNDDVSNGIDLNRNFDFLWMTVGASDDPCTHTYAGPYPASEPETRALANYTLELSTSGKIIYYLAFHSYSQMVLIPYSHSSGIQVLDSGNYADMYEVAVRGASKLTERYGTDYFVGTAAEILYQVSGSSFDWVKGVIGVPIVYVFELRDRGEYAFLLPSDQIVPNSEEIMDCLVEMDRVTRQLGYYSGAKSLLGSLILVVFSIVYLIMF